MGMGLLFVQVVVNMPTQYIPCFAGVVVSVMAIFVVVPVNMRRFFVMMLVLVILSKQYPKRKKHQYSTSNL